MRNQIRNVVNGVLGRWNYEFRRKHEAARFFGAIGLRTIIDGGANIGEYSQKMRAIAPDAEIYAFEPAPKLFQRLRRRFAGDSKITCCDRALGDISGKAVFYLAQDNVSSSLLQETNESLRRIQEAVTIQVITLDEWSSNRTIRRPALLKLDLEGNELAALRGAEKFLTQIDYIELETTFWPIRLGQPTFKEILDLMDKRGFDFLDMYPGNLDPETGRSIWADALFARRASPSE